MGIPLNSSFHSLMYVFSNGKTEKCAPILLNGKRINMVAEYGSQTTTDLFGNWMALMVLLVHILNRRHFEDQEGHSPLEWQPGLLPVRPYQIQIFG